MKCAAHSYFTFWEEDAASKNSLGVCRTEIINNQLITVKDDDGKDDVLEPL